MLEVIGGRWSGCLSMLDLLGILLGLRGRCIQGLAMPIFLWRRRPAVGVVKSRRGATRVHREALIALSSRGRASAQLCARSDAEAEKQRAHAHHLWVGRVSRQMADEVGLRKLGPR